MFDVDIKIGLGSKSGGAVFFLISGQDSDKYEKYGIFNKFNKNNYNNNCMTTIIKNAGFSDEVAN